MQTTPLRKAITKEHHSFSFRSFFQPVDLTQGACWRTILVFSFPIIVSCLLQQVYSISDAAIVGQTLTDGEVAGVRRSMAAQIVLSAALTLVLTALALVLLDPMLAWINVTPDSPEVYRAAYTYCAVIFAGIGA